MSKAKSTPKKLRFVTKEESLKIIETTVLDTDKEFVNLSNHKPWPYKGMPAGTYRFTVNIMSLDVLINLMEHPLIENVFFNPCAAAPGEGMDSISMAYRVYVKHKLIED